jgi:uncharacterized membrane protein YfcA
LELFFILTVLGLIGGMISGLLGIGGAIIMIPLVLFVPLYLGLPAINMKDAAGMVMVQAMFASLAGVYVHRKHHYFNSALVIWFGVPIVIGALTGGILSKFVDSYFLTGVFGILTVIAYCLILLPNNEQKDLPLDTLAFNRPIAVLFTLVIGLCMGMVGAGGAFVLVPLMINFFNIPTRVTIGSSLGIVLMSSIAGFIGKAATGQIPHLLALALVIGAIPGALAGSFLSNRIGVKHLKLLLAGIIGLAGGSVWLELIVNATLMPIWQALLLILAGYLIIAWLIRICLRYYKEVYNTNNTSLSNTSNDKGMDG